MGVSWDDCFIVAELLGIKTFLNEFVAYEEMNKLIKNRRQQLPGSKLSVSHSKTLTLRLFLKRIKVTETGSTSNGSML